MKPDEQVSSHWRRYLDRMNRTGVPFGFGTLAEHGLRARVDAMVGVACQLAAVPSSGVLRRLNAVGTLLRAAGLHLTQDALRQVYTIDFLERHGVLPNAHGTVVLIGDGFGLLTALVRRARPGASIVAIDLPPMLEYQRRTVGDTGVRFCPADQAPDLPLDSVDLAINVASMQEMDPAVVRQYFGLLRQWRTKVFYCCNRERKTLPDGTVSVFAEYPWSSGDVHLVDEPCPWHQRRYGVRHPLGRPYDGVHRHRLTRMAPA